MRATRTKIPYFLVLMCCLLNIPAFAGAQGQSAAFLGVYDYQVGAFVVSDSGRLYQVVLNLQSNNVLWEDLGGPVQLRPTVSATYVHAAFVIGVDSNLYSAEFDGAWHWYNHGNPGVTLSSGNMSAISYAGDDAVFVVGDDDSLYVNWRRDGGPWQWSALGGRSLTHYLSAVSYHDNNDMLHIEVYVVGGDGNLYVKFWDGNTWQWGFVGRPNVSVGVAFPWAQVSGFDGHTGYKDVVFVVGNNGRLYSVDINNTWVDRAGSQLFEPPAGFPANNSLSPSAFIVGGDGTLYKNISGTTWTSPGGCNLQPFVSPIDSGAKGVWIFAIDGNGSFLAVADTGAGPCWNWSGYDLSLYPGAP